MPRYFILSVLLLAVVTAVPVFAADNSFGQTDVVHGGLVCFSVSRAGDQKTSCDKLCAAKDAVCVGLKFEHSPLGGFGCADTLDPLKVSVTADCRCCALENR
jgi:hypothetical protein